MKAPISYAIVLWVFLLGCSHLTPAVLTTDSSGTSEQLPRENLGQILPIGAQAIMGGEVIELEVAKTEQQKGLGLMFRKSLPANRGMLFAFDPPQYTRFWMKNVEISLDIIFLQGGIIQAIASNVPPCNSSPCPTYGAQTPIDQVIELRGKRAAELGLKVGDRIRVEFLDRP